MKTFKLLGAAFMALTIAGCEGPGAVGVAEGAASQFHERFAKADYAGIYWSANPKLHLATSEADFVALLAAVQRKLGDFRHSKPIAANLTESLLAESTVDLAYQTTFASGEAVETFQYVIDRGHAVLLAYSINSQALITR